MHLKRYVGMMWSVRDSANFLFTSDPANCTNRLEMARKSQNNTDGPLGSSRGSPHAVSMKGRQRRHRSDLSERPAGMAGRGVHAAHTYHGSHLWYRDQTVPRESARQQPPNLGRTCAYHLKLTFFHTRPCKLHQSIGNDEKSTNLPSDPKKNNTDHPLGSK